MKIRAIPRESGIRQSILNHKETSLMKHPGHCYLGSISVLLLVLVVPAAGCLCSLDDRSQFG